MELLRTKFFPSLLVCLLSVSPFSSAREADWGVELGDKSGQKVKIGGRLQGVAAEDSETGGQDFYLRRVRLNLKYRPWKNHAFVYDIRNDNANKEQGGDGKFSIGDAYWRIDFERSWINNLVLFRSKVDVSYTQTSSSKHLFDPNRPSPANKAAEFVVAGRRAPNIQVNGNLGKLYFQLAAADGVDQDTLSPLRGDVAVDGVNYQKLTYGGKLRYFLVGDAQENVVQDTFYGLYDQLSLGVGFFQNDKINIALDNGERLSVKRALVNAELSYSQGGFRFLSEYFSFDGVLTDLSSSSEDGKTGEGEGSYAQMEYVFGELAPFVGHESLDHWVERGGFGEETLYAGINYYQALDARRFGAVYKSTERESSLGGDDEQLYIYAMTNF